MTEPHDDEVRARTDERVATELETFRYSVSHDLRFPLRVIDGYSRALEEDYAAKLDEEGRSYVAAIRKGVARLDGMVARLDELLRLASQPMAIATLDVTALARQLVEAARARTGRDPVVEIADGLTARGDRRLVEVAFAALIDNAFKFTAKTAAPAIAVGQLDGALFVRDNGVGFDAKAERLFTPFRRLHGGEWEGEGIGLALVQRVVARHGGRVWAESSPGHGATLLLTFG